MPVSTDNVAEHADLTAKLSDLRGLVLDCDGVLTPSDLYYDQNGNRLLRFHAHDGLGIALLTKHNVRVGVLSGRPADIAEHRFAELGVEPLVGRCKNKARGIKEMCQGWGITLEQCAFVGDDLPDLPALSICGLPIAVANAVPEVIAAAQLTTTKQGGRGAVREVAEAILKAKGDWETWLDRLRQPGR